MSLPKKYTRTTRAVFRTIALLAITCAFFAQALAQTAADTQIQNQATASYSDGGGGNYSTVSNVVIVKVSKVSGLTITPDAGTNPTLVAGQTGVNFSFRVTNTGNFSDQVRFLASGASASITGPATISAMWIDVTANGTYTAGTDIDIKNTAGVDVLSPALAQNAFFDVIVQVNVNAAAAAGATVNVKLGDTTTGSPSFDNQLSDASAGDVRTVSTLSVNGLREARGDRSATVDNDAQLVQSLTAPTGPVPLGSNITYVSQLCNTGARVASAVTLTNAPAGSNTGVFIIAPIPAGTALATGQTFPAGTLYSVSPLASNPLTVATWTTTAPASLATVTRMAFNVGATLAAGACSANVNMVVTITTPDATNPINEQVNGYGNNSIGTLLNAPSPVRVTTLQAVGLVLNGPVGQPGAVGPTNNNDDYTNKSVNVGIAGIPSGGNTTAAGTVTFTNTVQNTGNSNDVYTLSVPTFPAGSTVKVTVGATQVTVVNNGVATGTPIPTMSVAFGATANYVVDVTLPAGNLVLTGFDTIIRATSANTTTATNDTIDRLYTGFLKLTKTATVSNTTGVGAATDPVPGARIIYAIVYLNIASTGGTNCPTLSASNIVITENGNTAPNNWATFTDHVVGATDSRGGTITGDALLSTVLTDTVAGPILAGQSGTFTFTRQIK